MESLAMHVTMVKKRLASGEPCRKCVQAEDLLRARGAWSRIDQVLWADETDAASEGMRLAGHFGIDSAPFFIVQDGTGATVAYESVLKLLRERFEARLTPEVSVLESGALAPAMLDSLALEFATRSPEEIVRWALTRFGRDCAIAFSGAEDVALIDMAARSGGDFSVFCLDTGRLHAETYRFIDRVRAHYDIEIALLSPEPADLEPFVRKKGLFSFYEDGHQQCCSIRKVAPLRRALAGYRAWMTGQRRDQSPTRAHVAALQVDPSFSGRDGALLKLNPLAATSSAETWAYLRQHDVPFNPLHERGFASIGCEPCTRPTHPGQHEREGRWWWEAATQRECGLHSSAPPKA